MRQIWMVRTPAVRFLFLGALAACGDAAGPDAVARVDVTPAESTLWAGDTLRLAAVARRADGGALERAVAWSSSNAAVATVDAAGLVTAVGPGEATVTATADGSRGEATITVAAYDLVFESQAGSAPELFILPLQGGAPVRVRAPGAGWAADPAPSPDGTRIAFVVWDVEGEASDIWVVNRDGGGLRQLTDDPEIDDQPAWSPDGARIAFRSYRAQRDGDIWVMNADGSQPRALTTDPLPGIWDEARPAWSPDGARIAFVSNEGGDVDLWTMRADGSDHRQLTNTPDFDTDPAWSPDGATLLFRRSNDVLGSDLMTIPATGGEPARISIPSHQRQGAWSPDGRVIAYVEGDRPSDPSRLYTMRPDGTGIQLRIDPAWRAANPAFIRRPPSP